MAAAWLCTARNKVCTAPASARCLRKELWTRSWRREDVRLPWIFGSWECLQSRTQRVRGVSNDLRRLQGPSVCLYHSASAAVVQQKAVDGRTEEFKLVYRFPGIKYCRVLSRLKLLQTATSMIMLPPICYLYLQGQVSQNVLFYTTGIAVFAGAMLYGMSYFFRRIIGLIYLSETGQTVRVAHLTFWGRRNDIYCPIETVVTLDEVGDRKDELLHQFKRSNSTDTLYFTIKYGQIVDKEKFTQIFGELV
ncbi:transmembrane protein 186 isoform X2 [Poecile atricapillus]|uniref:transmembrane protein 186 isoform X2 n=1 Tax=Poecile atricapillus TaxID=48891 RepID=UPI002738D1C7|nr:transmembrane protein 186 isoform X2 [Poecile atricapillus]